MEKGIAELVVAELKKRNGPKLSLLEAMAMTKVMTDDYEMYAIQKGNFTFIACVARDCVNVKTMCW